VANIDFAGGYSPSRTRTIRSARTPEYRHSTQPSVLKWALGVGKSLTIASASEAFEPVDVNGYTKSAVDRILTLAAGPRVDAPTDPKAFLEWLDKL
jgi:hypothetical protein